MSETGLAAFDTTVQKPHASLNAVMQEPGAQDRHQAYMARRATLHALGDRMPADEAVQLGAQLPMLVRGFYCGELADIKHALPAEVRELWPAR
jgi:uncharacterized protein (DUF2267 family)